VITHLEPISLNEKAAFCDFFAPFLYPFLAYKPKYVLRRGTKMGQKIHQKSTSSFSEIGSLWESEKIQDIEDFL
jgi:hypothetical protein